MGHLESPEVSVIVVSDYNGEAGHRKSWTDERRILTSLAGQDFEEPFDVVLIEHESYRDAVPSDLSSILPELKVHFSTAATSSALKNSGVSVTTSPFVAILEADCILNAEWLRVLVDVLRKNPAVAAVSGKTIYGTDNLWRRCFSLLDRAYMDLGRAGQTENLSNNSALYRRELLERYPYTQSNSPFISASIRLRAIRRDGHVLFFDPGAVAIHAFGWKIEKDLRRNRGFLHMTLADGNRWSAILKIPVRKLLMEAWHCKRLGREYLRRFDWLAVFPLLILVRFLEIPGMIDALANKDAVPGTAYR